MNNETIYISDLASLVNLLRRLDHLRLWIDKQDMSAYEQPNEYYVIDQYDRILAEWDNNEKAWMLREPAWEGVADLWPGEPVSFFAEILREEQIFELSLVESIC